MTVIQECNSDLTAQLIDKQRQFEQSIKENAQLKEELRQIKQKGISGTDLLVGSSLIRNIAPTENGKLHIRTMAGAKLRDIENALSSENIQYNKITIVGGTKDCSPADCDPEDVISKYKDVIQEAKKHCDLVAVSSVLPRNDNSIANKNGDRVNSKLSDLCRSLDCLYIDNNGTFKLADGSINEAMLDAAGFHLSERGTRQQARQITVQTEKVLNTKNRDNQKGVPKKGQIKSIHYTQAGGPM